MHIHIHEYAPPSLSRFPVSVMSSGQWPAELCVLMRAQGSDLPSGAFTFFFLSAGLNPVN